MYNYLNLLIHHLLKAGRRVMTDKGEQDINLIHFRIHHLLNAKFHCNQNTFISLLKTLALLDSS